MSALHVTVHSVYGHESAAVPSEYQEAEYHHTHSHHHHHDHNHSHEHNHSHNHDHNSCNPVKLQNSSNDHVHQENFSMNENPLRNLAYIQKLLQAAPESCIPFNVKNKAINVFTELAMAEATVHGAESIYSVHFHEVGAVDSIIDTVGVILALDSLHVESVSCSRLPLGEGTVRTAHGLLPVPAPATLHLLRDMPTCPGPPGITGELVTPTAAALLRTLTKTNSIHTQVGRCPRMMLRNVGVGAGSKDFLDFPNIIRVLVGEDILTEENQNLASNELMS